MSSISRRRNGLMALSVIGGSCLGCGSCPSISRQDAHFPLLPQLSARYKLPRERFSPSARLAPCRAPPRRSLNRTDSGRSVGAAGTALHVCLGFSDACPSL